MHQGEEDVVFDEEASPAENLKRLREKLKVAVEEKQNYLNGWQRAKADFVNFKRDADQRIADMKRFGEESVLGELLPLVDQFDMAVGSTGWGEAPPNFRSGVEGIRKGLHKILETYGLKSFDPTGERFDPMRHEPLRTQPVEEESDDQKILKTLQVGYEKEGKVIRPAKVELGHYEN